MALNSVEEILADIKAGKMVVIMDDEDRENEGDLVMAAVHVRTADINFMARHGRGLICLTLTRERCQQLRLPLMVNETNLSHRTNFTLSIEAAEGVSTGISAQDRATTIQAAVAEYAKPEDLVQPGHIFPIMAQPGGVLTRAGHTEAGCDLARLAGLQPAAVIVEILNEDGTMARRPQLELFAQQHGLRIGTIADLIHYRLSNEKTVERVAQCQVKNPYGEFHLVVFQEQITQKYHYALVKGNIHPEVPTVVRVHMQDWLTDALHLEMPKGPWPLHRAFARVSREDVAVVLVLSQNVPPDELIRRIEDCQFAPSAQAVSKRKATEDLRTYGVGAQILGYLGVGKMRVLSAPKKVHGIAGFGLEVVEYLSCD